MLDVTFFSKLIRLTLDSPLFPDLDRAVVLLLGTAAQESGLRRTTQFNGGPARGFFQMEPATARDHHYWLVTHPKYAKAIAERSGVTKSSVLHLEANIPYQILMARLHYYRRAPDRLPFATDLPAQAQYWKRWYNTPQGKGTVEQYIDTYQRLIAPYWSAGQEDSHGRSQD